MRIRLSKATILDLEAHEIKADGFRCYVGGESGSGKSNAAALIAEQVIMQDGQVIVLDSHGEYGNLWALNPSRIVRIGYGDDPVTQGSIEWCMLAIDEGKSLLIDLAHWTDLYPKELDAFAFELIRGLYELRRRRPKLTLLIVEEAQSYCPQQQASGQADNVRVFISIATGGRKFGLQTLFTTQRQSLVDSNIISSCNVRILLRTSEVRDWKRIRGYIPTHLGVTFNDSRTGIRHFEAGEALVLSRWTPEARLRLLQTSIAGIGLRY